MNEQNRPADGSGHDDRSRTESLPAQPWGATSQQGPTVPPHQGWGSRPAGGPSFPPPPVPPAPYRPYPQGPPAYGQVGAGQVGAGQVGAGQVGAGQVGSGQVGTGLPPAPPRPVRRTGRWRIGVAGLVAGALIGGGAGAGVVSVLGSDSSVAASATSAQNVVITDPQEATSATAAAAVAAPSVVTVYVSDSSGSGSGSGVVLSADGYVLTNNHVVTLDSSTDTAVIAVRTADGTLYDATVVGTDPSSDLAVVRLTNASGLTPATFADSDAVQVGDLAVAIGAPLGLSNTVTDGIISATDRAVATGSDTDQTVIDALQTDAAINPGNSGGALVNAAGEVVGINTAIASVASGDASGQSTQSGNIGVGFAIPAKTASRVAQEIIENGSASHSLLGVSAQTAAGSSAIGEGAQITQVQADSPAADAGLQAGDVIVALGDRAITTSVELTAAVRSSTPGETVTLTVQRGQSTDTVDVTLGSVTS